MPKLLDKQVSFIDFPLWRFGTIGGMIAIYKKKKKKKKIKKKKKKKTNKQQQQKRKQKMQTFSRILLN